MRTAKIERRANPRFHADGIAVVWGSSSDARTLYDGTNDEWTIQTKDAGGTQTDRFKVKGNQDATQFELYNDDPGAVGIQLDVFHESASPAASDVPFELRVYAEDDGGTKTQLMGFKVTQTDVTAASDDVKVELQGVRAGSAIETWASWEAGVLTLQNLTDGASVQGLVVRGDRATPADNDEVYMSFELADDAGNPQEFVRLVAKATDVTAATKDGRFAIQVMTGNSLTEMFRVDSTVAGVVTMTYSAGDIVLDDNVSIQFGTAGADADLSSNGTDLILNLLATTNLEIQDAGTVIVVFDSTANVVEYRRDVTLNDNISLLFGTSGADGDITSDGTNLIIDLLATTNLRILDAGANVITLDSTGNTIDFYRDLDFQQASTIRTISGKLTISVAAGSDVEIGDDVVILTVGGAGSVGIGGGIHAARFVFITGSFTGSSIVEGLRVQPTLTPGGTNNNARIIGTARTLNGISTQTHPIFAGIFMEAPIITLNSGTVTLAATLYVEAAPTNGGTNDALHVAAGRAQFHGSVACGSPTGGDKGNGTINATAVYDDNVLLTDYVFEKTYNLIAIPEMRDYFEQNKHLPTIPGRDWWNENGSYSVGQLATRLWETAEVQARYIAELEERISRLEPVRS